MQGLKPLLSRQVKKDELLLCYDISDCCHYLLPYDSGPANRCCMRLP